MMQKIKVIILVAIALILATTAISLNIMDSEEEVPTTKINQNLPTGAVIGIDIQSSLIEDKLTENTGDQS